MARKALYVVLLMIATFPIAAYSNDVPDPHLITAEDIINDHSIVKQPTARNFAGPVLAFITPWNSKGYDVAKELPGKFNYISPCWFEIVPTRDGVKLNGEHDVDKGWMKEVRSAARAQNVSTPLIVPRVLLELQKRVFIPRNLEQISAIVQKVVKKFGFDGVVLDTGYDDHAEDSFEKDEFLKELANELHSSKKKLIVVVPPIQSGRWHSEDVTNLMPYLDGFSIMTYDFTSRGAGPNAPLSFFSANIGSYLPPAFRADKTKAAKLFLGMNLYGYDSSARSRDPVLGTRVLELLQKYSPNIVYHKDSHEHSFSYKDDAGVEHTVYYPTVKSMKERLDTATELYGVGISLWEIGQGLNYFYDLF